MIMTSDLLVVMLIYLQAKVPTYYMYSQAKVPTTYYYMYSQASLPEHDTTLET